jgi:hypothetical protein
MTRYILCLQILFESLHRSSVKRDFLFVESVLFKEQIFLNQINSIHLLEHRMLSEQLMRKQ